MGSLSTSQHTYLLQELVKMVPKCKLAWISHFPSFLFFPLLPPSPLSPSLDWVLLCSLRSQKYQIIVVHMTRRPASSVATLTLSGKRKMRHGQDEGMLRENSLCSMHRPCFWSGWVPAWRLSCGSEWPLGYVFGHYSGAYWYVESEYCLAHISPVSQFLPCDSTFNSFLALRVPSSRITSNDVEIVGAAFAWSVSVRRHWYWTWARAVCLIAKSRVPLRELYDQGEYGQ